MRLWKNEMMVRLEEAVVARYEKGGDRFEILVSPHVHEELEKGKALEDLVAVEEIFKDARKGDRASEENVKKVFGTGSFLEAAKRIIKEGTIQLTTEQRRRMQEEKWKAVVNEIARNCFNPKTKAPHPPQRIEAAMKEAKVHVDPTKSVQSQIKKVLDKISPLLPISFEKVRMAVKINPTEAGRAYGELQNLGTITKDEWTKTGEYIAVLEIPGGLQGELMELLNKKFKNGFDVRLLK